MRPTSVWNLFRPPPLRGHRRAQWPADALRRMVAAAGRLCCRHGGRGSGDHVPTGACSRCWQWRATFGALAQHSAVPLAEGAATGHLTASSCGNADAFAWPMPRTFTILDWAVTSRETMWTQSRGQGVPSGNFPNLPGLIRCTRLRWASLAGPRKHGRRSMLILRYRNVRGCRTPVRRTTTICSMVTGRRAGEVEATRLPDRLGIVQKGLVSSIPRRRGDVASHRIRQRGSSCRRQSPISWSIR
jgi:hypothetical protein